MRDSIHNSALTFRFQLWRPVRHLSLPIPKLVSLVFVSPSSRAMVAFTVLSTVIHRWAKRLVDDESRTVWPQRRADSRYSADLGRPPRERQPRDLQWVM